MIVEGFWLPIKPDITGTASAISSLSVRAVGMPGLLALVDTRGHPRDSINDLVGSKSILRIAISPLELHNCWGVFIELGNTQVVGSCVMS